MKTASVRDLRNHYSRLLTWVSSGEEILITRRGKPVARLVPDSGPIPSNVDWSQSAAFTRDRTNESILSAEDKEDLIHESGGQW